MMAKILFFIPVIFLSASAVRQENRAAQGGEDTVQADSNIRPSEQLLKVLGEADSKAAAKEMGAKIEAQAAELALVAARQAKEQEAQGETNVGEKDEEFEAAKKRYEEAIQKADAEQEAAEKAADEEKGAARKLLEGASTKAKEAAKEVAKYKRYVAKRKEEEAQLLPGLLKQVADASQRIESLKKHTTNHEAALLLAEKTYKVVAENMRKTEALHDKQVQAALDKLEEVEDDSDAKVDAAKKAKDDAEAALSTAEHNHGGDAMVTAITGTMVQEKEAAKARADKEWASAMAAQEAVHSFQNDVKKVYGQLTETENLFHRRLYAVLQAADTDQAKAEATNKMEKVNADDAIKLGKEIYNKMDALKNMGGVIIKDNAELGATISTGLKEIGATMDTMMAPVCKWYAMGAATQKVDAPGASACEIFKAEQLGPK